MSQRNSKKRVYEFSSQHPADDSLTPIAIAARPEGMIADMAFPRLAPVNTKEFVWLNRSRKNALVPVDTRIGRRGTIKRLDTETVEVTDRVEDYGVATTVADDDQHQAASRNFDPAADATEEVMDVVHHDRERRVAGVIGKATTYPANQVETLTGSDRFRDPTSSPIQVIEDLLSSMPYRPNTILLGETDASVLLRHPEIVRAHHGNDGGSGIASPETLRTLFRMRNIGIGQSFLDNTGVEGDLSDITRVWDGFIAFLHVNPGTAGGRSTSSRLTFGATQPYRNAVAFREWNRPGREGSGLRGSWDIVAGESVKEFVSANYLGSLIVDPSGPAS